MSVYSQKDRFMGITTPLGTDKLLLESLTGHEAISELFQFQVDLLAPADTQFTFDQLLGQSVTIRLNVLAGNSVRYLNGIVIRLSQGEQIVGTRGGITFFRYHATIVPKVALLLHRTQSKIYEQITVPDILKKVFAGYDVAYELSGTYKPRDYCSQYRESDWDFASRLMEEEGIFYFFDHTDGAHKLVLGDVPSVHKPIPAQDTLIFETAGGGVRTEERILSWTKTQEIRSGKVTLWDHIFELPHQHLEAFKPIQTTVTAGTVSHKLNVANDKLERYDYPGAYAQRFDGIDPGGGDRAADVQNVFTDNTRTTEIRMQQVASESVQTVGTSTCRQLVAGHKFKLTKHFNADGEYVLTRVEHHGNLVGSYVGDVGYGDAYRNSFKAIPFALPFRPQRVTPKAMIHGTQTAVVVGPPGEEIFTDKYSRVKVQFHWDRDGKKDAQSSCWVRVATHWAGKQWGAIHIPRMGQEVVVAFEEADPDRPIIVGSVYNAEMMPPYTLPDNRTQSGIKTRSSLKGTPEHFNELRFEDKKGVEQVYFHAEKNFDRVVENNDTLNVGFRESQGKPDKGDRTVTIFNNETYTIGKPHKDGYDPYDGTQVVKVWNNQDITVGNGKDKAQVGSQIVSVWNNQEVFIGKGKTQAALGSQKVDIFNNQEFTIGSGKGANADGSQIVNIWKNRTVELKTGDDTLTIVDGKQTVTIKKDVKLTIQDGNREEKISKGNDKLTVSKGNIQTKAEMGFITFEAMQKIELKVGSNTITIDQTGIAIKGAMVKIEGQSMFDAKAPMTKISGDGMLMCKGGVVMIN